MGLHVLKLVHIFAVVMLFAGQLPLALLFPIVTSQMNPVVRLECMKLLKRVNMTLLMPGSILAGATGFALAGIEHIPMVRTPWLFASILLYIEAMTFSMGVLGPAAARLSAAAAAEAGGGAPGQFAAALAAPLPKVARFLTLASTLLILTLMVLRPGR